LPLSIRLDMLHLIIQAAMGWSNGHLWLIHAHGSTWGVPDPDYPDDTTPANRTFLLNMIADIGTLRVPL
jgi:pRiA4b ORF-3-like protein